MVPEALNYFGIAFGVAVGSPTVVGATKKRWKKLKEWRRRGRRMRSFSYPNLFHNALERDPRCRRRVRHPFFIGIHVGVYLAVVEGRKTTD